MSRNEADAPPPPLDCRLGSGRADDLACGLRSVRDKDESRVNGRIDSDDELVGEVMTRGSGGDRNPADGGENGGDDGGDDSAGGDVANRDEALPPRCPIRRESALRGLPPSLVPSRRDRDGDWCRWCGSGEMTGRDAFGDRELNLGESTPNEEGSGGEDVDGRRSGELARSRRLCKSSATR